MNISPAFRSLYRFKNQSILNEVIDADDLRVVGDQEVSFPDDGRGLQLKSNQVLYQNIPRLSHDNITNFSFNIGMWMKSSQPGYVDKNALVPVSRPVADLFKGYYDPAKEDFVVQTKLASIEEEVVDNTQLRIKFNLYTADGSKYFIHSLGNSYHKPDVWNHFIFSYYDSVINTTSLRGLVIFINGTPISTSLNGTEADMGSQSDPSFDYINENLIFAVNRLTRDSDTYIYNDATIDELFITGDRFPYYTDDGDLDSSKIYPTDIINSSVNKIVNTDTHDTLEIDFPIMFNDPSTVAIDSIYGHGSEMYLGKNNGKLEEGTPLLWDHRRQFKNIDEESVADTLGSDIAFEDGYMKIKKGNIKL